MRRSRVAILAGTLAFLTAAGAGMAYAAVTNPLGLGVNASAATPGVDATSDLSALNFTYDEVEEAYATAGAVTIQNTGTRDAAYRLTVTPHDATAPNMPAQISISVGTVASTAACTTAAALGNAQSGTLATTFTYDSAAVPVQVAPGQSVVLCVQTEFDDGTIGSFGETSVQLDIAAQLVYAAGAPWTVTDAAATVTQEVVSADLWLLNAYPIARYWVDQVWVDGNDQLQTYGRVCKDGGIARPVRFTGTNACADAWNSQWRLVPVPDSNAWWILAAVDNFDQPSTPRWTYAGNGNPVVNAAPNNADPNQQWVLKGNGDGTYRIVSVGGSAGGDVCLTTGGAGNSGGTLLIVPATCDSNSTTQSFTFTMNGVPHPGVILDGNNHQVYPNGYPLTCGGTGPNDRALAWPAASSYGGETHYRVMLNGVEATIHTNGHSTSIVAGQGQSWIQSWWAANGGGNFRNDVTVVIEQKITSLSSWIPVTEPRTITILHLANNNNRIYCSEPNLLPVSSTLNCPNSNTDGSYTQLGWATSSEFGSWAEYRVMVNGQQLTTTGNAAQFDFNSGTGFLQTWWAANGGGQFQPSVTFTVEQRITSGGSWVQIAGPRTMYWQHYSNSNNRVVCATPAAVLTATPGFSCTNGPGNFYNWQPSNGNDNGLVTSTYRANASYRIKMGADVFGTSNNGYSYNFALTPQANQAFYAAHQGAQTLTVEYSLDGGASWNLLASKNVTVADPGGSPAGFRVMSGC
ncbi:MAG TPA: hypothetical protein VNQ52_03480 [Microbacteriaceae bacterium]|nr:hypothetical protein [Microbacteriaceae bacterium]